MNCGTSRRKKDSWFESETCTSISSGGGRAFPNTNSSAGLKDSFRMGRFCSFRKTFFDSLPYFGSAELLGFGQGLCCLRRPLGTGTIRLFRLRAQAAKGCTLCYWAASIWFYFEGLLGRLDSILSTTADTVIVLLELGDVHELTSIVGEALEQQGVPAQVWAESGPCRLVCDGLLHLKNKRCVHVHRDLSHNLCSALFLFPPSGGLCVRK